MRKIERIYRLDGLLELANFDFENCEESDFLTLIRNYSNLLADFNDDFPFISPSERFSLYMKGLSVFEDTGALDEKKKYFMGIQRHLLSRLYVQIPTSHEKYPVSDNQKLKDIKHIEINGVLSLEINQNADAYVEKFVPAKTNFGVTLKMVDDKFLIDLMLSSVIREYALLPNRFFSCVRCNNVFYQPTAKPRMFCKINCGGATRQATHRKAKTGKARKKKAAKK
jgi:hypothetical protein